MLVMLQGDLGTALIMLMIAATLLILARVPFNYLMTIGLAGLVIVFLLIVGSDHRRERFAVFFNPDASLQDSGLQVYQAKIAIGSGGFFGLGYGMSRQKFSYIPEVSSDSVFPIIAEELGFIGSAGLICLILLICWLNG